MDSVRSALIAITVWLAWLPRPVVAVVIVVLAAGIAYSLHKTVRRFLTLLLADRFPYGLTVLNQMRGVTRLALLIVAMVIAIPVAPFDPDTADVLARMLLIAVIGLFGWTAVTALNIACDLYLRRFKVDTFDNLLARKHLTQVQVLRRTVDVLVLIVTVSAALMTFEPVRQYGVSLFASAGVAGLIAGLAARPVLSNLFAGVQLAITQPIRIDDSVVIENEWGWIEEITSTYVVVRVWDLRRLIVPLSYFIEKPFQNWTRENSTIIGSAFFYVDYRTPVARLRAAFEEIVKASNHWNRQVVVLQVTDVREQTMEVRCLMSAANASKAFDLCCEVREKLIDFMQREMPEALPRQRGFVAFADGQAPARGQPPGRDETAIREWPAGGDGSRPRQTPPAFQPSQAATAKG
ncbi:MAG: mechanosensitive ion channel [Rhodopseudomonas sp.]|nr:mechanosensitive ion channel [Rhodopseudomonas sp.]